MCQEKTQQVASPAAVEYGGAPHDDKQLTLFVLGGTPVRMPEFALELLHPWSLRIAPHLESEGRERTGP